MKKVIHFLLLLIFTSFFVSCAPKDKEAPIIQLTGDGVVEVEVFSTVDISSLYTVTDNISANPIVSVEGAVDFEVLGQYDLTIKAIDQAGNESSALIKILVLDKTPPVINLAQEVTYADYLSDFELAIEIVDNYDDIIEYDMLGTVDTNTIGDYRLEITATDSSGNTTSAIHIVSVKDMQAPIVDIIGSQEVIITLGEIYEDEGAFAMDLVDGDAEVIITSDIDYMMAGSYSIVYSSTDQAGNQGSAIRSITIEPQTKTTEKGIIIALNGLVMDYISSHNITMLYGLDLTITNNHDKAIFCPPFVQFKQGKYAYEYLDDYLIYNAEPELGYGETVSRLFEYESQKKTESNKNKILSATSIKMSISESVDFSQFEDVFFDFDFDIEKLMNQ